MEDIIHHQYTPLKESVLVVYCLMNGRELRSYELKTISQRISSMSTTKDAKKPELMTIKPQASHEEIKRNLIAYLARQGIHVKTAKK